MVTTSSIGSGKKVNVGQSFASGMSALQTVQKEKFVIIDESGTKKDAERLSLFKLKDNDKTYIVYTFNEVDENDMMSEQEILAMRGELNPDNDNVRHRSRRLKRRQKR